MLSDTVPVGLLKRVKGSAAAIPRTMLDPPLDDDFSTTPVFDDNFDRQVRSSQLHSALT